MGEKQDYIFPLPTTQFLRGGADGQASVEGLSSSALYHNQREGRVNAREMARPKNK